MTPDGDRLIETLKPGDLVWSRPEHLPDAPLTIRRIEHVFELEGSIVELHIGGQVIKTTGEHPFYVEGLGWSPAFELTEGQRLIGHNGQTMPVERIVLTEQSSTVYNLRIAEDHTYFVGQDDWEFSVWVHNAYNVKTVENGFEIFEDGVSCSIKNREDFDLFYKLGKITKQQYDDALAAAAKIAKKQAPNKVKVTSWAEAGKTPDLNPGRWVQVGEPTVGNYLKTGLSGGKFGVTKQFPFLTWQKSNVPFANYISDFVDQTQLMWPKGWEFIKGVLGQRIIK